MRKLLFVLSFVFVALASGQEPGSVSGRLKETAAGPVVQTAKGDVALEADEDTSAVLHDKRLDGMPVEAHGKFRSDGHFQLDPFFKKPLWIVHDGHRKEVTYWCNVCSIRTYTPGKCLCCQAETDLDLREKP